MSDKELFSAQLGRIRSMLGRMDFDQEAANGLLEAWIQAKISFSFDTPEWKIDLFKGATEAAILAPETGPIMRLEKYDFLALQVRGFLQSGLIDEDVTALVEIFRKHLMFEARLGYLLSRSGGGQPMN